jgi:hypothetical protein
LALLDRRANTGDSFQYKRIARRSDLTEALNGRLARFGLIERNNLGSICFGVADWSA